MGGLPRHKPQGHRRRYLMARYDHSDDIFEAWRWSDDGHTSDFWLSEEPHSSGPAVTFLVMLREDFETREREGRAVDLSAPGNDAPPRGMSLGAGASLGSSVR